MSGIMISKTRQVGGQNILLYCPLYNVIRPQEMRNAGVLQDNCQAAVLLGHRITEMKIFTS